MNQKIELVYGSGSMKGVLGSDTIQVTWKPGAESELALGAITAYKTDAGPAGKVPTGVFPCGPVKHDHFPKSPSGWSPAG